MKSSVVDGERLIREAEIMGKYLVGGAAIPTRAAELYKDVIASTASAVSESDIRRLAFVHRHPWSVGLVDAGLSFVGSKSEVRRRLYVLFSILETQPELHQYFLSQERPKWYVLVIGWNGMVAGLRAVCGFVFIKVVRI